jgi:hypothetical protein
MSSAQGRFTSADPYEINVRIEAVTFSEPGFTFIKSAALDRVREVYLDDDEYAALQGVSDAEPCPRGLSRLFTQ